VLFCHTPELLRPPWLEDVADFFGGGSPRWRALSELEVERVFLDVSCYELFALLFCCEGRGIVPFLLLRVIVSIGLLFLHKDGRKRDKTHN